MRHLLHFALFVRDMATRTSSDLFAPLLLNVSALAEMARETSRTAFIDHALQYSYVVSFQKYQAVSGGITHLRASLTAGK